MEYGLGLRYGLESDKYRSGVRTQLHLSIGCAARRVAVGEGTAAAAAHLGCRV